jgi:signal peptidase II
VQRQYSIAAGVAGVILVLDLLTKRWAVDALDHGRTTEALGGWLPLTLAFNQGAAFGLTIGTDPRWIFIPITILAVVFLVFLIIRADPADHVRVLSASLVLGGALGNLYDRLRWERGVVDFIGPINLGFMHWPIFNVADSAITCGAILLAISFWREDTGD